MKWIKIELITDFIKSLIEFHFKQDPISFLKLNLIRVFVMGTSFINAVLEKFAIISEF